MSENLEPIYGRIAKKIVTGRKWLGMTQEELARETGMSRPALANIEAGRQRVALHDVQAICNAFEISPSRFMRGVWS